jgi:hypothetical protein
MKPHRFKFLVLTATACVAMAGFSAAAASAPAQYRIRLDRVIAAIQAAHPELAGDAVQLAAAVDAREPEPAFRVGPLLMSPTPGGPGSHPEARVRVECAMVAACLPFYAWVQLPADGVTPGRTTENPDAARFGSLQRIDPGSSEHIAGAKQSQEVSAVQLVHAGEHARLLIDSGFLHLNLPVICLQAGAVGKSIRVRTLGKPREYAAIVVNATTVRGYL